MVSQTELGKITGIEGKGWRCGEEDACAGEEDVRSGGSGQSLRPQSDSGEWIKVVQRGWEMALDDRQVGL